MIDLDTFGVEQFTAKQRAYKNRATGADRAEANAELHGMEIVLRQMQPLVEIARAAKAHVETWDRLYPLDEETDEGIDAKKAHCRADDRMYALVRQHLLAPAPSQPEEQGEKRDIP